MVYTDHPTDKMLVSVWNRIERMKPGQIMVISEHCNGYTELFTKCCMMYIDCFKDGEFSNDYTIFRKLDKVDFSLMKVL